MRRPAPAALSQPRILSDYKQPQSPHFAGALQQLAEEAPMTSRKLAKLCFVIIAVATSLPAQPSSAADFAYLSATGGGTACTAAAPCSTFLNAFLSLLPSGGRILCLDPVAD